MQSALEFPVTLSEKYRPQHIADFVGLDKAKKIAAHLVANPKSCSFLFSGASGTGKTTLALAIAAEMPAELHHIAAKDCTLETINREVSRCYYMPHDPMDITKGCKMHLVLVDEADQMSYPAQIALLSLLDSTAFPPNTVFIFTCNATDRLEARFLSRCLKVEFSSYGMSAEVSCLLQRVWHSETQGKSGLGPNFARIVKDSCNNVRDALMSLETELMCA